MKDWKIFTLEFSVDGVAKTYQIPARDYAHALIRLGQVYGDKEGKDDRVVTLSDKSEMVSVPVKWLAELLPYVDKGMEEAADALGKAGHTPSEVMEFDIYYFDQLKELVARV